MAKAKTRKAGNKAKKPAVQDIDKAVIAWADFFKTEIEYLGIGYK